jgi:FG-GAP-like repeat/Secretion system C-terminal sorting domain
MINLMKWFNSYKSILFIITISQFQNIGYSQLFEPYPIEIITDHVLTNPYAGGLIAPQFSEMDLNLDGKKDIVIFEKSSSLFIPMINEGNIGTIKYKFDQNLAAIFPKIDSWAILRDYNRDGLEDIFTGNIMHNGIEVWQSKIIDGNIQFAKLFFENTATHLVSFIDDDASRKPIQLALGSFPEFVDVDKDGDLDILAFDLSETYVVYYKNLQVEKGLSQGDFDFILYDECFGKFRIDPKDSKVVLSDRPYECSVLKANQNQPLTLKAIHGGSSLMAFDQNCDDLIDLLLGDGKTNNIRLVVNGGTKENGFMVSTINNYPSEPIDISFFASTYYLDVNNDGANDLIAVHNDTREGQTNNHVWLYINEGTQCAPVFKLTTKSWMVDEIFNFTSSSKPALADINGDELIDLVVGGHIVKANQEFENRLLLFLNIGTPTDPKFKLASDDYLNFSNTGINYSGKLSPTFGDLDGNGSTDLIVGDSYGKLFFARNMAEKGKACEFATTITDYSNIMVGANAVPCIIDLDQDGLNDLVIANFRHNIIFFKNVGSPGFPQFIADQNHPFNAKNLGNVFPDFTLEGDLNGSLFFYQSADELNMILGTRSGSLRIYGPIIDGFSSYPIAKNISDQLYFGKYVNPVFADINSDNLYELVLGNQSGGIRVFKTDIPIKSTSSILGDLDNEFLSFPNPTSGLLNIHAPEINKIQLIKSNGDLMIEKVISNNYEAFQLDMTLFSKGLYILKLYSQGKILTQKVIKM